MPTPSMPCKLQDVSAYFTNDEIRDLVYKAFQVWPCYYQLQAMKAIFSGKDVIGCAPTGASKTLSFWIAMLMAKKAKLTQQKVLVISPLNLLAKQNVDILLQAGFQALLLTGETFSAKLLGQIESGKYDVCVTNPEMLVGKKAVQETFQKPRIANKLLEVVLNEGHTVDQWADFCLNYKHIGDIHYTIPGDIPFYVASATLPPNLLPDVQDILNLQDELTELILYLNDRPDINLAVQTLVAPAKSYHDLDFLFPDGFTEDSPLPPKFLIFFDNTKETIDAGMDIPNIKFIGQYGVTATLPTIFQCFGRAAHGLGICADAVLWVEKKDTTEVRDKKIQRQPTAAITFLALTVPTTFAPPSTTVTTAPSASAITAPSTSAITAPSISATAATIPSTSATTPSSTSATAVPSAPSTTVNATHLVASKLKPKTLAVASKSNHLLCKPGEGCERCKAVDTQECCDICNPEYFEKYSVTYVKPKVTRQAYVKKLTDEVKATQEFKDLQRAIFSWCQDNAPKKLSPYMIASIRAQSFLSEPMINRIIKCAYARKLTGVDQLIKETNWHCDWAQELGPSLIDLLLKHLPLDDPEDLDELKDELSATIGDPNLISLEFFLQSIGYIQPKKQAPKWKRKLVSTKSNPPPKTTARC
ncbi:hypothetical protein NP233_g10773 [Leucocoprinus birnbaumii]|uniref:DNA 3'-5' helicase n=1 Tax=Leucocoprinus birnbaumii TaxID=56174 RepID=A0AAD5VNP0_9AGAR|nr:hypothetical protein NP233_g10773 [Leucocoprinus birnbaumii]